MWKSELTSLAKNKMLLVSLIAIACIPMIYASLFLGSIWDPYAHTDTLGVAVVNEDRAVDYQGTHLAVGDELVSNLKKNDAFDWQFVSPDAAKRGIADGTYYMVVTIPKDFSAHASTVLDKNPKKMEIAYETNPGRNFLSDVIMTKGMTEVGREVREQVTTEYARTIFAQITTLGSGVEKAAAGSADLSDGTVRVAGGSSQIAQNLEVLRRGTLQFHDGSSTLTVGLEEYLDGVVQLQAGALKVANGNALLARKATALVSAASELDDGATSLAGGVDAYTRGVDTARSGAQKLTAQNGALQSGAHAAAGGLDTLASSTAALPTQAAALDKGARSLSAGISALSTGSSQVSAGASGISSGLDQLSSTLPSGSQIDVLVSSLDQPTFDALSPTQQKAVLDQTKVALAGLTAAKNQLDTKLVPGAKQVASGAATLDTNIGNLEDGAQQVAAGTSALSQSAPALSDGVAQVAAGVHEVDAGVTAYTHGTTDLSSGLEAISDQSSALRNGSSKLAGGTSRLAQQVPAMTTATQQLRTGSSQVAEGATVLVAHNTTLDGGALQLTGGSSQLVEGATALTEGATTLSQGAQAINAGAETLAVGLSQGAKQVGAIHPTDATYTQIAAPTTLTRTTYRNVSNYGAGLAPYFLSLVLYVGAIAFSFIYPIKKPSSAVTSVRSWWASKLIVMVVVGVLQALLVDLVMVGALGMPVASMGKLIVLTVAVSVTYVVLVAALAAAFDNVGRFIATVFMVLQLACAGGMFPITLSGGFFQALNPLLPMTYAANGYREALFGALGTKTFLVSLAVFALYLVVAVGGLYCALKYAHAKTGRGAAEVREETDLQCNVASDSADSDAPSSRDAAAAF